MWKSVPALLAGVLMIACMAVGQDDTQSRIELLQKQMEAMRGQMEAMGKQLERLKGDEVDRKIDDLSKRLQGVEAGRKPEVTAGHKKNFYVKSADDMFCIEFDGRIEFDWWMYEGGRIEPLGNTDMNDTLFLRRVRPGLRGHVWGKSHKFRFQGEFAGGSASLEDAYIELDYVPWLRVRFGQYKQPFGRERLQSTKYIQFVERALISDLLTNRRGPNIMAHGKLFDGHLSYATSIFDGAGPNTRDDNDAKDWAYRLVYYPFNKSGNPWIEGFEIGHDLMLGNQPLGPGLRGRTAGDVDYFPPVLRQGERTTVGVDGAWYIGPFGLTWEYIHADQHRGSVQLPEPRSAFPSKLGSVEHAGWYTTFSYVLTGEKKTAKMVIPKENFDPLKGKWGAWEVACRIEQIEHQSRDTLFTRTYTDDWGNPYTVDYKHQQDTAFTIGVNWYLNPNVALKVAWVHDWFDEALDASDREIDTVQTRCQIIW